MKMPATKDSEIWRHPTTLPDGHRLFEAKPIAKMHGIPLTAIADKSAMHPQDTDDGILWLDRSRSLIMGGQSQLHTIPVVDPDGKESRVSTDGATIILLSNRYRWNINAHGLLFRAVRGL